MSLFSSGSLQRKRMIGPNLPPSLASKRKQEADNEKEGVIRSKGTTPKENAKVIGPTLPAHLRRSPSPDQHTAVEEEKSKRLSASDDDEDVIGPLPPSSHGGSERQKQKAEEERAFQQKLALIESRTATKQTFHEAEKVPKGREEWMMVPPSDQSHAITGNFAFSFGCYIGGMLILIV